MKRVRLAVLVAFLGAAGRASAEPICGSPFTPCCPGSSPTCNSGLVCDPTDSSGCEDLVWLGEGDGGAAQAICPGTCVRPTATPTSTPTATPTSTPTPTPTPTPHNLKDNDPCNDSRQCTSTLCNGGVCAERNPAPAVSNHIAVFMAAGLLLLGLWSVRRVARRR